MACSYYGLTGYDVIDYVVRFVSVSMAQNEFAIIHDYLSKVVQHIHDYFSKVAQYIRVVIKTTMDKF